MCFVYNMLLYTACPFKINKNLTAGDFEFTKRHCFLPVLEFKLKK